MAPMMVMTSATTAAKIGRTMKKRLILMGLAVPARGAWACPASFLGLRRRPCGRRLRERQSLALGRHLDAGAGALQPPGEDPLLGEDTFAHHAQTLVQGAELDVAPRHAAVFTHGVDEFVGLVGADRLVGQQ